MTLPRCWDNVSALGRFSPLGAAESSAVLQRTPLGLSTAFRVGVLCPRSNPTKSNAKTLCRETIHPLSQPRATGEEHALRLA